MTDFNCEKCEELISQNKYDEAAGFVKLSFSKNSNWQSSNLELLIKFVKCEYLTESRQVFLLELFRVLRNLSTTPHICVLFENSDFLVQIVEIFRKLNDAKQFELLTKIFLQFLINTVVCKPEISTKIAKFFYNDILECFRRKRNNYEVLALLYNLHLQDNTLKFAQSFYETLLESFNNDSCEYSEFLVELFIHDKEFWTHYKNFKTSERIIVLEIFKKLWLNRNLQRLPNISLQILSETFRNSMEIIFQMTNSDESLEPYEISLVLDILGCLCSDEIYLKLLQEDKELIIRSGVVLINLHRLGKSDNCFTPVQKLSELKEPNETLQKHPAFGFKVGLVRLIGNLCWKNKQMQDLAREAEIIPVLLDCCNIDARNPLIMQWVIFSIRNLCENNLENQRIIAGLHKEGTVSSAVIEEMGLTLHDDESGGIRIVPLDLRK